MKIVSFCAGGVRSFGPLIGDGVVDAGKRLHMSDLGAALTAGALDRILAMAEEAADYRIDSIDFLPVIPNPGKILCVGVNYAGHLKETGRAPPPYPMIFPRYPRSQVGHGQALLRPPESTQFDFEGELAIIIGKEGRRIAAADALAHVAGYSCYNDGTLRDWQRHSGQFMPGKNFERSGALGPWLVTTDEITAPADLWLETRVNDVVMQRAPVSDLIFDLPTVIAYISTFMTLMPGDVIATGTPDGVGAFRDPPSWLHAGDVVEVEISNIGILRNRVVDEPIDVESTGNPWRDS